MLFHNNQTSDTPRGQLPAQRRPSRRLLVGLAALVLLLGVAAVYWLVAPSHAATNQVATAPVVQADLSVQVESSGTVKPNQSLDLSFASGGRVAEVYVKANQTVETNQRLARLDDKQLRLALQQAEADVQTAQARLQQAQEGSATPQTIAENQAAVNQAQAELEKARTGGVTQADIREAEAAVRSAQAKLDAARNPSAETVNTAQTKLDDAQRALQRQRDELSAAKTSAQLALERSTDALVQAQSAYATAKSNWSYVDETGQDAVNPETSGPNGAEPNNVSDAQRQQYYDAYVQAEAALRSAERAVQQAQVDYDSARQQEVAGIQQAEGAIVAAQRELDTARNPSPSAISQAEADLQQAQARLDKLRQGGAAADVASAQANVQQAQARLEKLTAPSSDSDVAIAAAALAQAQAKQQSAQLELESVVLTAPFSGTLTAVNVVPGSVVTSGAGSAPAFALADMSAMYIDVSVSESDIARVQVGQEVGITLDALPDQHFTGSVTAVAAAATEQNDVVTYVATVQFTPESAVRVGMTANASIVVEQRSNVIQVPNRAIRTQGPHKVIEILYGEQRERVTVQVETGLTNGTNTEIVRCTETGNQCLKVGDQVVLPDLSSDTGGNAQQQDSLIQIGGGGGNPSGPPQMRPLP